MSVTLRSVCGAAIVIACLCARASAQSTSAEYQPPSLEGVGVEEHVNARLPLNLEFTDHNGNVVHLGDYFKSGRPVLLTLNYYSCPMLCTLMLNGLVDGLREIPLSAGKDYELVTVTIKPGESPRLANSKRQTYLQYWGYGAPTEGWEFLTGTAQPIEELAEIVGFKYRWDEETQQYAHTACAIFCTPDGRVSRYLYGVQYDPDTVRLTLVEAAAGKLGTAVDQVLLYCFQYDAAAGSYVPVARNIMKAGGLVVLLALAVLLVTLWRAEKSRSAKSRNHEGTNLREKHV